MGKTAYMSWEDVLGELQMNEDELQQAVADVKLRAFKDGGTLKFRRTDVVDFKEVKENEPTMVQPGISPADLAAAAGAEGVDDGATLLEVPPAGDTQEIPALPQGQPEIQPEVEPEPAQPAAFQDPSPSADTESIGIEPAPADGDEDEIGTELNFDEVPLGDTAELPATDPKLQDSTDTDISLEGFDLDEPAADDITDTVIPTIELSSDDEPSDDTTDTVIPTIELSADDDLTDDTSDTVIPTIELSPDSQYDVEGTETAFPTIELGDGEPAAEGDATADLPFGELGETSQETADFGLATDGGMEFGATETEENIPTFEESSLGGIDTQQETSPVESQVGYAPGVATGVQTAPIGGPAFEAGDVYLPVEDFGDIRTGSILLLFLLATLAVFSYTGMILFSAVGTIDPDFQSPEYLEALVNFVRNTMSRLPAL